MASTLPKRTTEKKRKRKESNQSAELKEEEVFLSPCHLACFFPTEAAGGTCGRFHCKGKVSEIRCHFTLTQDCFICQSRHEVNSGIATMSLQLPSFSSSIECSFKLFSHTDIFLHVKQYILGLPLVHNKYSSLPLT